MWSARTEKYCKWNNCGEKYMGTRTQKYCPEHQIKAKEETRRRFKEKSRSK